LNYQIIKNKIIGMFELLIEKLVYLSGEDVVLSLSGGKQDIIHGLKSKVGIDEESKEMEINVNQNEFD
jgi:hypothetical protein